MLCSHHLCMTHFHETNSNFAASSCKKKGRILESSDLILKQAEKDGISKQMPFVLSVTFHPLLIFRVNLEIGIIIFHLTLQKCQEKNVSCTSQVLIMNIR